jgi:26S proteasome regulatory subunit N6
LIDYFPPSAREMQMKVTNENIKWARSEKRVFLRQSLEIKLIGQYVLSFRRRDALTSFRYIDSEQYRTALNSTDGLLKELKQLDDKIILTEVYMLESRAAHAIQNMPRAKVSYLTYISD